MFGTAVGRKSSGALAQRRLNSVCYQSWVRKTFRILSFFRDLMVFWAELELQTIYRTVRYSIQKEII
eukprot:5279622-Pyramimonas_sp.AAC.1